MGMLVAGLLLFLGTHSVRIVAEGWRTRMIDRLGRNGWRGAYSLLALAGLVLIVYGYGVARVDALTLFEPPQWVGPVTSLLMLPALVLAVAAYVPGTRIKAVLGHPLLAATKLWAAGHLLANGRLADVILFGAFLLWAGMDFNSMRRRDRIAGVRHPAGPLSRDALAIVVGAGLWVVMLAGGHGWLTGVYLLDAR